MKSGGKKARTQSPIKLETDTDSVTQTLKYEMEDNETAIINDEVMNSTPIPAPAVTTTPEHPSTSPKPDTLESANENDMEIPPTTSGVRISSEPTSSPDKDRHLRLDITWTAEQYEELARDSTLFYKSITDLVYNIVTAGDIELIQWQTNLACPNIEVIDHFQIKDYVSTKIGNDRKRKLFFFSFRTSWPQKGIVNLLRQQKIQTIKREWHAQIETSNILTTAGDSVVAGDLLMLPVEHLQRKNFD